MFLPVKPVLKDMFAIIVAVNGAFTMQRYAKCAIFALGAEN